MRKLLLAALLLAAPLLTAFPAPCAAEETTPPPPSEKAKAPDSVVIDVWAVQLEQAEKESLDSRLREIAERLRAVFGATYNQFTQLASEKKRPVRAGRQLTLNVNNARREDVVVTLEVRQIAETDDGLKVTVCTSVEQDGDEAGSVTRELSPGPNGMGYMLIQGTLLDQGDFGLVYRVTLKDE